MTIRCVIALALTLCGCVRAEVTVRYETPLHRVAAKVVVEK